MTISVDRIAADIQAIADCTLTPGQGATRPTFTPAWAKARAHVVEQINAIGGHTRVDAAGNLHARPAGLDWNSPAWLVGSHLDSVPNGGDYDGVAGVLTALELLRSANDDHAPAPPIELIDFAEEEGPTFGLGMIGSRLWVGDLQPDDLTKLRNADGQTYIEAGQPHGVTPDQLADDRLNPARYLGLIELHIEQGPGLWRRDQRLGVVYAIAGRRQYHVALTGEANHAGATAMTDRRDALAAAAEMTLALEQLAPSLSPDAVITVGRLDAQPNAVNVVPGRVAFTIDFRAPDDATLDAGHAHINQRLADIASRRRIDLAIDQTEAIPARAMAPQLVDALLAAAPPGTPRMVSGALHDAAVIAPHLPTAMLFVPSRDGISHNPAEFSRVDDIAAAVAVVEQLVRRPILDRLNALPTDAFVAALDGLFEHSPWVVQRAAAHRPFASRDALLDACQQTLDDAAPDERLALIRAHPDLVGRLARSGQLTADSTAEQRAAGLDDITPDEAATFDEYNAAYHDRFGFPFVICARENRKDAILAAMPKRLQNKPETEIDTALAEIIKIARLRLADKTWEP